MPLVREIKQIKFEFWRNFVPASLRMIGFTALLATFSSAATIFDSGVTALKDNDAVQLGFLNRTLVPSDWSTPKPFPGTVNPTVAYRYETFGLPTILYPFLQISIDDLSGTGQTLASAYLNAYMPGGAAPNYGLNINYLGDAGNTRNLAGNPRAFQVVVPLGATLVLVVNDISPVGAGVGQPFRLLVEGFTDTNFSDAPEPATYGLVLAALGAGAFVTRRRNFLR